MPDSYNPQDWYWFVAGDETKAYSSATGDYVQPANPAFVAWLGRGNAPTRIASEADLGEVLAAYSLRPAATAVLDGYQDKQSRELTLQVVAKVLLWLVNEVRALKSQQPIQASGFRAFIKGLL